MRTVTLGKTGEKVPVVGQGTWGLDRLKSAQHYQQWKQSLQKGIELGMTHIDTAEAYGFGKAEAIVGEVAAEYGREDLFITTKLFPVHITHNRMKKAAYHSLNRLNLEYVDLYLVHWPNPFISIERHMRALEELVKEGKTRYIGVSNYSVKRVMAAQQCLKNTDIVTYQVNAHLKAQNHLKFLPYYQKEGITLTAYSPLAHRGFTTLKGDIRSTLEKIAQDHKATIQQIAIAWLINMDKVITIPKALQMEHVKANAAAADIILTPEEMEMLTAV